MEKLIQLVIELVKILLNKEITQVQAVMLIALLVILVFMVSYMNYHNKYKKLKKRVLNNEIQVININVGKKGKTKKVIKTKKDLRNPKKNKSIMRAVPNTNAKKGVTSVEED